jgi:cobalt/nickel transport system ATP-binding protein
VTHDLVLTYELCERTVILDQGRIAADGPTWDVLADRDLLAAHDLELPFGFVPPALKRAGMPPR